MSETLTEAECEELLEAMSIWMNLHNVYGICVFVGNYFDDGDCPSDFLKLRRG